MRLIDADKLFHEYLVNELWNIPDIAYSTLLKQPTVEAIPISWLEKWFNSHKKEAIWLAMASLELLCQRIIDDWEEENE